VTPTQRVENALRDDAALSSRQAGQRKIPVPSGALNPLASTIHRADVDREASLVSHTPELLRGLVLRPGGAREKPSTAGRYYAVESKRRLIF